MGHSRRDLLQGALAASSLVVLPARPVNAARPGAVPLRWQLDPGQAIHVQGADVLISAVSVWDRIPADLCAASVLTLDNCDNSARAPRFETCIEACRANGIRVAPEVVREGQAHESITVAWLDGTFRKFPNVVGAVFDCIEPGQLKTAMMREWLDVCGRNGAYFLYNMNRKANTLPAELDAMVLDPDLVATMKKYRQNIVLNYGAGGFKVRLTDAQKAERLQKVKKMSADGLIGRIACFDFQMSGSDVLRERANGCTAFGGNSPRNDYWHALRGGAELVSLRWRIAQNRPMHIQGSTVLRDMASVWRRIPADIRAISVVELDNYDNTARADIFEDCFAQCQKNEIRVMPEVVRYGTSNDSIHVAWLDGMFRKYPAIVGAVFDWNAPGQLKTSMMRDYLEVSARNGAYFFFNAENKGLTVPEDLDRMLADPDLVAAMKKYHENIVADCSGGGMRGTPTDIQKTENLRKLRKMLAEGLIGRIGCYRSAGSDVAREHANGCTVFGGNELEEVRNAGYWTSLRKVMGIG